MNGALGVGQKTAEAIRQGRLYDRVYVEEGGEVPFFQVVYILLFSGLWSSTSGFVHHLDGCLA